MKDTIQEPTVGRIVHYFDYGKRVPFPAMVVAVTEGSLTINTLHVFWHDGLEAIDNVHHKSEIEGATAHWDWMAYQKGQAAKTEALQSELDKKVAGK